MSDAQVVEYQSTLKLCAIAGASLLQFDIPKMLENIDRANSVGPILNPTLWMQKHEAMEQDAELLRAALPLWQHAKKMAERNQVVR